MAYEETDVMERRKSARLDDLIGQFMAISWNTVTTTLKWDDPRRVEL